MQRTKPRTLVSILIAALAPGAPATVFAAPAEGAAPEAAPAEPPAESPAEPPPAEPAPAPEPTPAAEAAPAETAPGPAPEAVHESLEETEGDAPPAEPVEDKKEEPKLDKHDPKNRSHLMHGFIGVGAGVGYGLITGGDKFCGQYSNDESDPDRRKPLCTGMIPPFLDIQLGFGAAKRIDVVVAVRINMMKRDYNSQDCSSNLDPRVCKDGRGLFVDKIGVGVLPGVRIWGVNVQNIVKFGGAIDILYMYENFSGYRNRPRLQPEGDDIGQGEDSDSEESEDDVGDHILGIRAGPALQIDPHHNVGIYFVPAVQVSFRPEKTGASDAGWFEAGFEGSLGIQARFP
jgi:hypothetical protein